MSEYKSKNHSKYRLMYHIIFVVKYRRKLLEKYGKFMIREMYLIADEYDFKIISIKDDKDHLHLLVESEPKLSPLMIVRLLKQRTTHDIWEKYENDLKRYFWHERTFWTDGYFCSTIGEVSKDKIMEYIENQGKEN